jgi:predicted enzyme related to lactoylglutathione lyase
MNQLSYFEIHADDIERARKFYSDVFGWRFELDPSIPEEYWRIFTDGLMGGLLKRHSPAPIGGQYGRNAFVSSMMVQDFDDMEKKIVDGGGKVVLLKFAVPGKCWQGYFIDTEGNMFGLFQVDENAK